MDAIQALMTRRSVRHFTTEAVDGALVEQILRAAMNAPSACNQQPWHFIVVDDRDTLDQIAGIHPYAQMLKQAPLAFIVCADTALETCPGYWPIDCSAAMENLLLAAHALGLGGVWVGIHPREERVKSIKELFNMPGYVMPLGLAAIGYASEPLPVADRYNPGRIHSNGW